MKFNADFFTRKSVKVFFHLTALCLLEARQYRITLFIDNIISVDPTPKLT